MLFLLASTAMASEIQVAARSPVVVSIDGQPAGIAGTLIDTRDLEPGLHKVTLRNFVGALLAEGQFELGEDERLRLYYDRLDRRVTVIDRVPLSSPQAPSPAVAPTPREAPPAPAVAEPELAVSETSSLSVTGVSDISGAIRVAGDTAKFHADTHSFVAYTLTPPVAELHIQDNGKLRYHGAVELTAGGHTECSLLFREVAWTVDCALTGPEQLP